MPQLFASAMLWAFLIFVLPDLVIYISCVAFACIVVFLVRFLIDSEKEKNMRPQELSENSMPPKIITISGPTRKQQTEIAESRKPLRTAPTQNMSGLVVDEPWISLILSGQKSWEMRSSATKKREIVALITKGTGRIYGTARIVGCRGPLTSAEISSHFHKHCVPLENIGKWKYAWELEDVRKLKSAIPYTHPKGAVIWVTLTEDVCRSIAHEINGQG